jgi:hypothetical protein
VLNGLFGFAGSDFERPGRSPCREQRPRNVDADRLRRVAHLSDVQKPTPRVANQSIDPVSRLFGGVEHVEIAVWHSAKPRRAQPRSVTGLVHSPPISFAARRTSSPPDICRLCALQRPLHLALFGSRALRQPRSSAAALLGSRALRQPRSSAAALLGSRAPRQSRGQALRGSAY